MAADLFGLEQAPPYIFDRIRRAGGVLFTACGCRGVLRELEGLHV